MNTAREALAYVRRHGIVLEAGRGPVPNLADQIAGRPIAGSWWGHARGKSIFRLTRAVRDSADVLVCRAVNGKVTFVHRRMWPALVRLAPAIAKKHLAALHEVHTASGRHEIHSVPYPQWVPREVEAMARRLSIKDATRQLGDWARSLHPGPA